MISSSTFLLRFIAALLATVAIFYGLTQLHGSTRHLEVEHVVSGQTPLTVHAPRGEHRLPVVILGHGFAGSRQMMQSLAITLARNGFLVISLDFAGHGANRQPFVPDLMDQEERRTRLLAGLSDAISHAQAHPRSDGSLAMAGHSMAGDIILHHMLAHPGQVRSAVLISPFIAEDTSLEQSGNLLFLFGQYEPDALIATALPAFGDDPPENVRDGLSLGDADAGTARRLFIVPGAEHIGIIHSRETLRQTVQWLSGAHANNNTGMILSARGTALGLLFLGLVVLAWPLSNLLPVVCERPCGAGLGWSQIWPLVIVPPLLTPFLLYAVPLNLMPLLLTDYLSLHFAVMGLLTLCGLFYLRHQRKALGMASRGAPIARPVHTGALLLAMMSALFYGAFVIGLAIHIHATGYFPVGQRWLWLPVIFIGTALYFMVDEWVTRGQGAAPGAYLATKLMLLVSLGLAVALRLEELFFLIIILPAIAVFLIVYGLFSRWCYTATGHPLVGGLTVALALAWAMSVTFPLVSH